MPGHIEVEGIKEFVKAVRVAEDRDLPARIGQANKQIGELVISRLQPRPTPAAVGTGTGSTVRPSAAKREVVLRAGGAHRVSGSNTRKQPWGRRVTRPGTSAPPRPFIQGTARDNSEAIGQLWLDAVTEALDPAFYKTTS